MNNEQQRIIDEVYEDYCKGYWNLGILQDKFVYGSSFYNHNTDDYTFEELSKEQFIDNCETNLEFSEKWGLRIEERELSLEERINIFNSKMIHEGIRTQIATVGVDETYWKSSLEKTKHNIPTKLITLTYKDIKIESYE